MTKSTLFPLPLLAVLLGIAGCRPPTPDPAPPPLPVITAEVLVRDQPLYVERIGQTLGSQDVEIRARVEGFLETVNFSEGMSVTSNALLYTIDDRPFRAALANTEGRLAQAQANWDKARRDTNRLGRLWEQNAISRQQFDDALAAEQTTAAALKSAEAALESARLELNYTRIHSPLDGLVGKTEVKPGNLVGRGASTLLTTVSAVDPISVRFSVSEQNYLEWRRRHPDDRTSQAAARDLFELILADGTTHPHRGSISFADRQVDAQTGTLLLEVSFPNPDKIVRPGQFARVRFPLQVIPNALLVPQRAVTELQATYSIFVARPDNTAEFRKVTPGPRVGTLLVIQDGLQAGERVVIEGVQKLRNNAAIAPVLTNFAAEAAAARPGAEN